MEQETTQVKEISQEIEKRRPRILMVDDESDLELLVRQRLRRRIRSGDYEFLFASNGQEALEVLKENPDIRLVLSDINMPVMDGLTLLSQLESADPDICAVIISAYGDMGNIRTAMNRGAFDFVTKPIDFNDLQITIDKTLRHIDMIQQALSSRDRLVSLKQELSVAKNVQMSVLPPVPSPNPYYDLHAQMTPAREIGGDFFDYFEVDEFHLGLVIADVSGKGVPAALFTLVSRALLKSAACNHDSPSRCLSDVNELLSQQNDSLMFVTLFYGVLDLRNGNLLYCNGGHNPPMVVRTADNTTSALPTTENMALGIVADHKFNEKLLVLEPGDSLFFFTDGITESSDNTDEEFGESRLEKVLTNQPHENMASMVDSVLKALSNFTVGMEPFDDVTCLALRWNQAKPEK
ncbi:MAG: SpoIIE family protein phosphatase [Gammaproteobacteria bacterium]|nr:SpoIIE family protein phosphatase [Gammaproteobacteria bacterium]